RRFVVATGSGPFVPPIPGLDAVPYLTNETIWDLRTAPKHLLIIGGGPIGMEMAQAHRRLGSEVTVIEGAKALGRDDPEAAEIVLARLRQEGVHVIEGQSAAEVTGAAGAIAVQLEDGHSVEGSHLLVAVGRAVNLDRLDLDAAGVKHTRNGVTVGPDLRSVSNRRVYAVGDAAGGLQFTHLAGYHAGVVIRSILFGLPSKSRTDHVPRVTYTDPELAQVGLTEAEAKKEYGLRLNVVRASMGENDRAIAEGKTDGFAKIMVVGGRPVGATIIGHNAGELIGLWALALANKLKMSQISNTVLPYPTLNEVSKRAAGDYFTPKLFGNPRVKQVVGFVQRFLP
ncbi:MAG: FAD-dependent oxidoreductase, partial [Pseudomonadota bacterium]